MSVYKQAFKKMNKIFYPRENFRILKNQFIIFRELSA